MLDPSVLANSSASEVNSAFQTQLESCLTSNGLSSDDINTIRFLYQNILGSTQIAALTAVATTGLNNINKDLTSVVSGTQADLANTYQVDKNSGINSSYKVQDATKGKQIPERSSVISRTTNIPAFPSANSELSGEYPNTYGKMDEGQNWFKVNKTTGYVEFIHNSGSSLKLDKFGNVSVHITGALKFIVDKDYLLNVLGNHDHGVVGNEFTSILGSLEMQSGTSIDIKASALLKLLGSSVEIN